MAKLRDEVVDVANSGTGQLTKVSSITGYARLETLPTDMNLKAGLQAAVADPLWMLARQWQFNEFQGEDAGSPIHLAFTVAGQKVDTFGSGPDKNAAVPLETRIEAEPVWKTHPRLRGEAGLQVLRMVANPEVRRALLATWPMELNAPTDPRADQSGLLWSTLFHQRVPDAEKLVRDLLPLLDSQQHLSALPAALVLEGDDSEATRTALENWYHWLVELVYEGTGSNPAWQQQRMEYGFSLQSGNVVLKADGYSDAHLDWDDFVAEAATGATTPPTVTHDFVVQQRLPSPARYPGMPAERFWEFEDGKVNFAGAEAGITDLLRMSVTEFALTFGNDWFVAPVRLPVGWLYKVSHFKIIDSFGIESLPGAIKPVAATNTPWSMFQISSHANLGKQLEHTLFLPDSLDGVHEGAVLEHTLLVRDEMANLAWAIEKTVQGVSGDPMNRDLEAKALAFQQQIHKVPQSDSPYLAYRLATPVPANWTPLLPVRKNELDFTKPLEIQLERAGMKRFYPEPEIGPDGKAVDPEYEQFLALLDAQPNFIEPIPANNGVCVYTFYPRGWLLRSNPGVPMAHADTLVIEEEEVPRTGVILKRKFQYARSSDGKSWLWVGRSKVAGRGMAESNLRFDVTVK
jgi:hypothetical protein